MDRKSINEMFNKLTAENFQDEVLKIKDELDKVFDENDSLNCKLEENKNTIEELRTTNQRLFLRVTDTVDSEPEDEKPKAATLNDILEKINNMEE